MEKRRVKQTMSGKKGSESPETSPVGAGDKKVEPAVNGSPESPAENVSGELKKDQESATVGSGKPGPGEPEEKKPESPTPAGSGKPGEAKPAAPTGQEDPGSTTKKSGGKGKIVAIAGIILLALLAFWAFHSRKSSEADITRFETAGVVADMTKADKGLIDVKVPFSTNLKMLKVHVEVSPKAKVHPADGETVIFTAGSVPFTVTAENGRINSYLVSVTKLPETSAEIEKEKIETEKKSAVKPSPESVIRKGEGVEHALIRQLLVNPAAWGYTGAESLVEKWAQGEAHRIAIKCGYVGYATGKQICVAKIGVSYVLSSDSGRAVVTEYDGTNTKADTNTAAGTFTAAEFAGDKGNEAHLQSYEYVADPYVIASLNLQSQKSIGEGGKIVGNGNAISGIGQIALSESVSSPVTVFCPSLN